MKHCIYPLRVEAIANGELHAFALNTPSGKRVTLTVYQDQEGNWLLEEIAARKNSIVKRQDINELTNQLAAAQSIGAVVDHQ